MRNWNLSLYQIWCRLPKSQKGGKNQQTSPLWTLQIAIVATWRTTYCTLTRSFQNFKICTWPSTRYKGGSGWQDEVSSMGQLVEGISGWGAETSGENAGLWLNNLEPHHLLLCWFSSAQVDERVNFANLQVNHGKFLPPAFMEGILDLVGLAMAVYAARGTARYEDLRKQLPEEYQDSYHKVIQVKVNICRLWFSSVTP